MKHFAFLFALLFQGLAAMAQTSDSVVSYRSLKASLTGESQMTTDKKHYEYLPINMERGDVALIRYESKDYVVALVVRDSAGHEGMKEDNPMFFETIGSKITLPFKAPAPGPYYFVFSSKKPEATGAFEVHLFYYNSHEDHMSSSKPFCEKLKYITENANTGFEFLKYTERQGTFNKWYEPTINLLQGIENRIGHTVGDAYDCRFPLSTDLEDMKKKFNALEEAIGNCLPGHEKKVYTVETVYDFERKDFIRKIEFSAAGSYPKDLNDQHMLYKIKDRVTLKLNRSGTDKYQLTLTVE